MDQQMQLCFSRAGVCTKVYRNIEYDLFKAYWNVENNHELPNQPRPCEEASSMHKWYPPPTNFTKINVGAGIRPTKLAISIVCRNEESNNTLSHYVIHPPISPLHVGATALLHGL